ncbi:MAG: sugar phosphate isomerase/epimerase family protein [Planctomycetota bacterium]
MTPETIAAQLYTVREYLTTPEDVRHSLRTLADAGFSAVQVSGMKAAVEPAELKAWCGDLGLTICATHEPGAAIVEQTDAVIARLQALGCTYTAYPHPHVALDTEAAVHELAAQLETAAAAFASAGLALGYHNHALEFRRFGDRTALDILYAEAPSMIGEIDTFWVQRGGADPVAWCERLAGRMPIVHLKDAAILEDKGCCSFCEVGSGNLDWGRIIAALRAGGCQWYIIEQDQTPGDPFASLARSREFLVTNYC